MTYAASEDDPEEVMRVRKALLDADRILIDRLLPATRKGTYERALLERHPATFDDTDRRLLARLAWHYRSQLPSWARPKQNPDDPIVRETDLRYAA